MQLIEYATQQESSPFRLGWRVLSKFRIRSDFQLGMLIDSPLFSDLLLFRIGDPSRRYSEETIDALSSRRLAIDKRKLKESDFRLYNQMELMDELERYAEDDDWGTDLPFYRESIELVGARLATANYDELVYLNIDEPQLPTWVVQPQVYSYYICVLGVDRRNEELLVLDLGGD